MLTTNFWYNRVTEWVKTFLQFYARLKVLVFVSVKSILFVSCCIVILTYLIAQTYFGSTFVMHRNDRNKPTWIKSLVNNVDQRICRQKVQKIYTATDSFLRHTCWCRGSRISRCTGASTNLYTYKHTLCALAIKIKQKKFTTKYYILRSLRLDGLNGPNLIIWNLKCFIVCLIFDFSWDSSLCFALPYILMYI